MLGLRGPLLRTGAAFTVGPVLRLGFWLRGALFLRTVAIWSISSMPMSSQGMLAASAGVRLALTAAIL